MLLAAAVLQEIPAREAQKNRRPNDARVWEVRMMALSSFSLITSADTCSRSTSSKFRPVVCVCAVVIRRIHERISGLMPTGMRMSGIRE